MTTTGYPGYTRTPQPGWVSVTYFIRRGDDHDDVDYTGPLIEEDDKFIRLEVWGHSMTFRKADCIIRYPEVG